MPSYRGGHMTRKSPIRPAFPLKKLSFASAVRRCTALRDNALCLIVLVTLAELGLARDGAAPADLSKCPSISTQYFALAKQDLQAGGCAYQTSGHQIQIDRNGNPSPQNGCK